MPNVQFKVQSTTPFQSTHEKEASSSENEPGHLRLYAYYDDNFDYIFNETDNFHVESFPEYDYLYDNGMKCYTIFNLRMFKLPIDILLWIMI